MIDFVETYNQSINTVRDLVEDIRFGRNLYLDPIKICSDKICNYLHSNTNFLTLLNNAKDKNLYMFAHPVNVAIISFVIGKWMNLKDSELFQLVCAGILHDIGKAEIRDSLLNKPGKLTEKEMEIIKSHSIKGFNTLSDLNVLGAEILSGVLSHHERQNGTGYPQGLKGEQINLFARIIAIADIYDAMTSTKAYNSKRSPFQVVEEIASNSYGFLDPQICQVFLKNISNFYPGSDVRLNNELVGKIVYINQGERTRPIIRCGEEYFNLANERNLEIVEML